MAEEGGGGGGGKGMGSPEAEEAETSESSTNRSGEGRGKRVMKKDDSGISVERSEDASSDEQDDPSKRQRTASHEGGDAGSSSQGTSVNGPQRHQPFNKLKGKPKERSYRKNNQTGASASGGGEGSSEEEIVPWNRRVSSSKKAAAKAPSLEDAAGRNSPDSGHHDLEAGDVDMDVTEEARKWECSCTSSSAGTASEDAIRTYRKRSHESEESESEAEEAEEEEEEEEEEDEEDRRKKGRGKGNCGFEVEDPSDEEPLPRVLLKTRPKHKWFVMQEVVNRQKGCSAKLQSNDTFRSRCYGSLHCVQRLELMYKMESHKGCINALHFNSTGTLLASGSDDLRIVVWDWKLGRPAFSYDSGHRSNVFQAKFLPLHGDMHVVSCARDGQVRLAELSSAGGCRSIRRLAQHKGPTHRLAIQPDSPHVFLSAGEDAQVFCIDVRQPKHEKILLVKEKERKVALYSIHSNPLDTNEFCVSGRDQYVRIYDKRRAEDGPLKKLCPHHLFNSSIFTNVTCAVFNYNGTEVLGSYNDEDIYLFDTRQSDGADYIHKYEGHRNNATVKGVNFFGPESQYVVSGSDCGNIFFWDKESEAIVQWMPGDENGVVNCLEPHPKMPVLATSGLDDDVKIWVPSCEHDPKLTALKTTVLGNQKGREDDRTRDPETFDGQMLWILWRHIRRTERRRRQAASQVGGEWEDNSSSSEEDSDSDESDEAPNRVQCPPS